MDKARVNHAIGRRCSAAQALEVFKIAPVRLGASRDQRPGTCIRASKTEHLMPCADQLPDYSGTYEPCGPCDEYTHSFFSLYRLSNSAPKGAGIDESLR